VAARINIIGQADYQLTDVSTGKVVRRGQVQSFSGYSSTSTTAATRAARADAEERLMKILADRVVADLLATSSEWRG
jgi:LPS-assembly lipoprotein